MKTMMKLLATMALVITFSMPAKAMELSPYLGAGVGVFSNIAGKTQLGGYLKVGADFSEYVGAELRLGSANGLSYFTSLLAKAQFEPADELVLKLYVGTTSASGGGMGSQSSVSFGLGADYKLDESTAFGVEAVRYFSNVNGLVATFTKNF